MQPPDKQLLHVILYEPAARSLSKASFIGDLCEILNTKIRKRDHWEVYNWKICKKMVYEKKHLVAFNRDDNNLDKVRSHYLYKRNQHFFVIFCAFKPVYCHHCGEYIWEANQVTVCCFFCYKTYHYRNCSTFVNMSCLEDVDVKPPDLISFLKPVYNWNNDEIAEWLCCVKLFLLVDVCKSAKITGEFFREINSQKVKDTLQIATRMQENMFLLAVDSLLYNTTQKDGKAIGVRDHKLINHTFLVIVSCAVCVKPLIGFYRQGLLCSGCFKGFHFHCKEEAGTIDCNYQKNCAKSDTSSLDVFMLKNSEKLGIIEDILQSMSDYKICYYGIEGFSNLWGEESLCEKARMLKNGVSDDFKIRNNVEMAICHNIITLLTLEFPQKEYSYGISDIYDSDIYEVKDISGFDKQLSPEKQHILKLLSDHYNKVSNAVDKDVYSDLYSSSIFIPTHSTVTKFPQLMCSQKAQFSKFINHNYFKQYSDIKGDLRDDDLYLEYQTWYWGLIPRNLANKILRDSDDYAFIVRMSTSRNNYTLSMKINGEIISVRMEKVAEGYKTIIFPSAWFSSICSLINHLQNSKIVLSNTNDEILGCNLYPLDGIKKLNSESKQNADHHTILRSLQRKYEVARNQEKLVDQVIKDMNLRIKCEDEYSDFILGYTKVTKDILDGKVENVVLENNEEVKLAFKMNMEHLKYLIEEAKISKSEYVEHLNSLKAEALKCRKERLLLFEEIKGFQIMIQKLAEENLNAPNATWYVGDISKDEVKTILKGSPSGTFLVRTSQRDYTQNVISITHNNKILHYVLVIRDTEYSVLGSEMVFNSFEFLIKYYKANSIDNVYDVFMLYPIGDRNSRSLYNEDT